MVLGYGVAAACVSALMLVLRVVGLAYPGLLVWMARADFKKSTQR